VMGGESDLQSRSYGPDETSLKYMMKLSAPMVISTISFTVMQFVDRFMVSRLGTNELAAILPAGFVSFIPGAFAIGVGTAVTTFVSQSLGRAERRECSNYCWQAVYLGLVYFAVVLAVVWPAAPLIFKMMGHEQEVARLEVVYLRIMLYSEFLAVFVWSSSQFFIGIHRPIITMWAAICAQVVNIAVNYILIFGKLGFPALGIAGAAWGTFAGIAVGAVIRMAVFLGEDINSEFGSRRLARIDFGRMWDLLKVGLPAGFELMLNVALWGTILFWLVGGFGKEAMAATSAVLACTNVAVMPIVGMKIALSAAVGKAIGTGRKDSAIKQTRVCLRIAMVYVGLIGICFFVFRETIMALWSSDDKVIEAGTNMLILAAVYQIFQAFRSVYSGSLRGAGDTLWPAAASGLAAVIILGLGGIFVVKFLPGLGALGPWIAATVSIVAVGLANRWRFRSNSWMRIDLFKRRVVTAAIESEAVVE
jgi:MATE family multidrug resistance protein